MEANATSVRNFDTVNGRTLQIALQELHRKSSYDRQKVLEKIGFNISIPVAQNAGELPAGAVGTKSSIEAELSSLYFAFVTRAAYEKVSLKDTERKEKERKEWKDGINAVAKEFKKFGIKKSW